MFYSHYRRKRKTRPTGIFQSTVDRSSPRLQKKEYRDWSYQISLRKAGLTQHRKIYSVTIWPPDGSKGHYIANLQNADLAQRRAEAWIDQAIHRLEALSTSREKRINRVASKIKYRVDHSENKSDSES